MDWTQALTIIGSTLVPTMAGFAWVIHRMDQKFDLMATRMNTIENRINNLENRLSRMEGFMEAKGNLR